MHKLRCSHPFVYISSFSLSALPRQYRNQHHHQPHTPVRRAGVRGSAGSRRSDVELSLLLSLVQCNQCLSSDLVQHPQHCRHQHATQPVLLSDTAAVREPRQTYLVQCTRQTNAPISVSLTALCLTRSVSRVDFPRPQLTLKHACRDHLRAVTRLAA